MQWSPAGIIAAYGVVNLTKLRTTININILILNRTTNCNQSPRSEQSGVSGVPGVPGVYYLILLSMYLWYPQYDYEYIHTHVTRFALSTKVYTIRVGIYYYFSRSCHPTMYSMIFNTDHS